jgi:citronellol/citronellal dehydrogenase
MSLFQNKTVLITGASRGIGKAIGIRLAREGANIIIAAKSTSENPKLGGTIYSAAKEMEQAGGKALPIQCDIRFEDQINKVVEKAVEAFGGIDIVINNASAINLSNIEQIAPKAYDLMQDINVRGTYMVSKACIPYLKKSANPHILTLSPPLNFDAKWFKAHSAYTISKYSMTMVAMGLAEELRQYNIASNTLWPKTTIATAAVQNLLGGEQLIKRSRTPEIMADAAFHIVSKPSGECTGNNFIDESVLKEVGIQNLDKYSVSKNSPLYPDLFL